MRSPTGTYYTMTIYYSCLTQIAYSIFNKALGFNRAIFFYKQGRVEDYFCKQWLTEGSAYDLCTKLVKTDGYITTFY